VGVKKLLPVRTPGEVLFSRKSYFLFFAAFFFATFFLAFFFAMFIHLLSRKIIMRINFLKKENII